MHKILGRLEVRKSEDYHDKLIKVLEEAGYIVVLDCETTSEKYYYVVAESEE